MARKVQKIKENEKMKKWLQHAIRQELLESGKTVSNKFCESIVSQLLRGKLLTMVRACWGVGGAEKRWSQTGGCQLTYVQAGGQCVYLSAYLAVRHKSQGR